MKWLLGAFLVLILLFLPFGLAGANGPVPHEDPEQAEGQNEFSVRDTQKKLLLAYNDFTLYLDREGDIEAEEMLEKWKDSFVPGYLQFITWRYRDLLLALDHTEEELGQTLEETKYAMDRGQREDAEQQLREAMAFRSQVNIRAEQLEGTTQILERNFKALGFTEKSPLEQLRGQQEKLVAGLAESEAGYQDLQQELTAVSTLEFGVPFLAYPGLPFQVRGAVGHHKDASVWPRGLQVRLDGEMLGEFEIVGDFDVTVMAPNHLQPGRHTISLEVVPKDNYLGFSQDRPLNVTQAATEVRVEGSRLVFLPGQIRVEGNVRSDFGEIDGATVRMQLGRAYTEAISEEGSFAATFSPSWDPLVIGMQNIRFWVEPREPWNTSAIGELRVVVVNWVDIGLVFVLMVSMLVAMIIPQALRKRKQALPDSALPDTAQPSLLQQHGGPVAKMRNEPTRPVVAAYYRAVAVVEERTGETMKPFYTLKDFLKRVQEKAVGEPFARITALAEKDLYGGLPLTEDEVGAVMRFVGELERDVAS